MKRFTAAALVLLLLVSLTSTYATDPGSAADPLISLSYINNTFLPVTLSDCKAQVSSTLETLYGSAEDEVRAVYDAYMLQAGGYSGYMFAAGFTPLSLPAGRTAELVTGSIFILASGRAALTVASGTVINISTGTIVPSGTSLSINERYFCAEDTSAVFTASADAVCQVDGYYKTTGSVIVGSNKFLDVSGADWFYEAVIFAGDNGLFTGTTETTFSPQNAMTRGMFVTVLYRLAGKPGTASTSVFPDVAAKSLYYYDAVVWANANNIVNGYDDGRFKPDTLITREQMAVIMYRYASYAGHGADEVDTSKYDSFPDAGSVSAFAADAMKWATANGLINGSDGSFCRRIRRPGRRWRSSS
jgi:hypothetical protein